MLTKMLSQTLTVALLLVGAIAVAVLSAQGARAADKEKVIHTFRDHDGRGPEASLIFDATGNLYGTTVSGGKIECGYDTGCGTVFQVTPGGSTWMETVLHKFDSHDGGASGQLILDEAGNIFGTVSGGESGNGNVFELSPSQTKTKWAFTVLHSFTGGHNGGHPLGGVIFDKAGNLYGTAISGGNHKSGIVFELVPTGNGKWTETVLYSFKDDGKDGTNVVAGLIFDAAGNLYGTTSRGGAYGSVCLYGCGTVFELTPGTNGKWTEKVLHSFNEKDGYSPIASLILDAEGNLYGTTLGGGINNDGIVFELSPQANGRWTERILHSFDGTDGEYPSSNVIFDAAGNLYGTTSNGGAYHSTCNINRCGTVFEVSPATHGKWVEKVLYGFSGNHGRYPFGGLIFDAAGNLYGDTAGGGPDDAGTVFKLAP